MKKWYRESYFDRKTWILENFDKLNLDADETLMILVIELCKTNKKAVTYEFLSRKLGKAAKDVDKIIASLVSKHYLKITTNSKGLVFDIDGIFDFDPEKYEIMENKDLYDVVSDIFNKPLSSMELQKMSDLIEEYGQDRFIGALRIAEAQRKLKMSYVEGILRNEKK